jgi:hypothetical protein
MATEEICIDCYRLKQNQEAVSIFRCQNFVVQTSTAKSITLHFSAESKTESGRSQIKRVPGLFHSDEKI